MMNSLSLTPFPKDEFRMMKYENLFKQSVHPWSLVLGPSSFIFPHV
jgi:hypothetical protein